MMHRFRRLAVYTFVTGLLAASGLAATASLAHADEAGYCIQKGTDAVCSINETINSPASLEISVSVSASTGKGTNGKATVQWSVSCTDNGSTAETSANYIAETPFSFSPSLPSTNAGTCAVTTTVSLITSNANNVLSAVLNYLPGATPAPPSSTSAEVKGYGDMCLDDTGNSSSNGAHVQLWSCNNDQAQQWTYRNGELVHNGLCLNDAGWGSSGTQQILYSCYRSVNELWTHLGNGEYVLNAKNYAFCLNDPAYSTRGGTRVIIYACKNTSNEHWSLP
jgi:hypothetical protein